MANINVFDTNNIKATGLTVNGVTVLSGNSSASILTVTGQTGTFMEVIDDPTSNLLWGISGDTGAVFDVNDDFRLDLPDNVSLWDVYNYDNEDFGFGSKSLSSFILINDPDVIMIYNDAEVIKKYIMNIKLTQEHYQYKNMFKNKNIKIVAYLDQVHTNQNIDTIKYISENTEDSF
jgi:hypothetical protein